jgi:putative cell wall-binding protein
MRLDGSAGTDFDLYLHAPDKSRVHAYSNDSSYPESVVFDAKSDGVFFIEVRAFSGSGAYRLDWSIEATPVFTGARRDWGRDRYLTAVAVSRSAFATGSASSVVLASGEDFPDALCASPLAGCLGSPVLLTKRTSMPADVLGEIERVGARKVYVVGGPGAVSESVAKALKSAGLAVERVYGPDRYATAKAVAAKVRSLSGTSFCRQVFLVRGDESADALSASAAAYALRSPIVLTRTSVLHPATREAITGNAIRSVYIVGGGGAVSDTVMHEVAALVSGPVVRLSGSDRYATASAVAAYSVRYYWLEPDSAYVARGDQFADALGGGAAAGKRQAVLVLTKPTVLSAPARDYLATRKGEINSVRIVGGTGAIAESVRREIEGLLRP